MLGILPRAGFADLAFLALEISLPHRVHDPIPDKPYRPRSRRLDRILSRAPIVLAPDAFNDVQPMERFMSLKDKSIVVTGGSRGLGLGLVEALVARDARVTVVARDAIALEAV